MAVIAKGATSQRGVSAPDLCSLSGKQAASLAGFAPISRQSGKWQGKERFQGRRAGLRKAIYLPFVVTTGFNPYMKAKYHELIANGNCKKTGDCSRDAQTPVMANALLNEGRKLTKKWT